MKFVYSSIISSFLESKSNKQNVRLLLRFVLTLGVMVTTYSVVFHFLMAAEGREYSWITGFYWTLVVMTTLGFGDVTFTGDIGKAFSILVLLSGVVFLLVLFPFTFIKFFLAPWMAAEKMRIDRAALIVATNRDEINTNIAFTVHELNEKIPIITTADSPHSLDILTMAGSSRVLQLTDIMGRFFAGWTLGVIARPTS